MHIAIINGPNLNLLGIREPEIYGTGTLEDLERLLREEAESTDTELSFFQSNHEGEIIDHIHSLYGACDGIILNPAGYTHTSVAIPDALSAVGIPVVEVHLSDPKKREAFRHRSFVEAMAEKTYAGLGFEGYVRALRYFTDRARKKEKEHPA